MDEHTPLLFAARLQLFGDQQEMLERLQGEERLEYFERVLRVKLMGLQATRGAHQPSAAAVQFYEAKLAARRSEHESALLDRAVRFFVARVGWLPPQQAEDAGASWPELLQLLLARGRELRQLVAAGEARVAYATAKRALRAAELDDDEAETKGSKKSRRREEEGKGGEEGGEEPRLAERAHKASLFSDRKMSLVVEFCQVRAMIVTPLGLA